MPRIRRLRSLAETNRAGLLYQRGDEAWQKGHMRSAFRFFLAAANAGMTPAFGIVGQFYDRGDGVRANQDEALRWYQRAYTSGKRDAVAAANIGCIWRDRGHFSRALRWFEKAVELGDGDANLDIAKIYLISKHDTSKAARYLRKTRNSNWATEGSKDEARDLLKHIGAKQPQRPTPQRNGRR